MGMSRVVQRRRHAPGMGASWCGLGFILAASVVNLLFDTYFRDLRSFPQPLANLLESSGKLGITVMLVGVGLAIIGFQWLVASNAPPPTKGSTQPVWSSQTYFYAPPPLPNEPRSRGPMVLETQRYLPPPPRLSELAQRLRERPTSPS
jgi:hypothetical protein